MNYIAPNKNIIIIFNTNLHVGAIYCEDTAKRNSRRRFLFCDQG